MRSKLKFALNLAYSVVVVLLVVFGIATALATFAKPANFRLFVVQSGSMNPALKTGSVVLIKPTSLIEKMLSPIPISLPVFKKGEVITYLSGKDPITHRVVGVGESKGQFFYQTKGDANKAEDRQKVLEKQILGKVILIVPYLGYAVSFARTQMGYISLIVIPVTIIIYSEVLNINAEIRKMIVDRRRIKVG